MTQVAPRFCKDCKWSFPIEKKGLFFRRQSFDWATCLQPSIAPGETEYLVTGDNSKAPTCRSQRGEYGSAKCGGAARLFEARK